MAKFKIASAEEVFSAPDTANGYCKYSGSLTDFPENITSLVYKPLPDNCSVNFDVDGSGNYRVKIDFGNEYDLIVLNDVEEQAEWENNLQGALKAVQDILSWKKKSSVSIPVPGDEGDVMTVVAGVWDSVPLPTPVGVVSQTYSIAAGEIKEIALPSGVSGNFLHQVFEVNGTQLIPQPNIQMYYDSSDSKWRIDFTYSDAMDIKIYFLS